MEGKTCLQSFSHLNLLLFVGGEHHYGSSFKFSLLLFCSEENPVVISKYVFRKSSFMVNQFCSFKLMKYFLGIMKLLFFC